MVVHQLDGDIAFREQADVVVELAGGDGAGAGLFDLGGAAGAQALVEVGGGDGEAACLAVIAGFEEEVREDGDGGLALDDGLGGGELAEEFGAGDGDLKVAGGRSGRGQIGRIRLGLFGEGGHWRLRLVLGLRVRWVQPVGPILVIGGDLRGSDFAVGNQVDSVWGGDERCRGVECFGA